MLKPVPRAQRTLRQLALDQLRDAILRLELRPGDRLIERNLCAQLGVSRTIIREVLRCLEGEGLVRNDRSGPAVAHPTPGELEQIYELRAVLEGMAASKCAQHATRAQISDLSEALELIGGAYSKGDTFLVLKHTHTFYQKMFAAAGCEVAWELVQALQGRISFYRAMTISVSDRKITGMGELRNILRAIENGEAEAAAQTTSVHIKAAASIALRQVSGSKLTEPGNGA